MLRWQKEQKMMNDNEPSKSFSIKKRHWIGTIIAILWGISLFFQPLILNFISDIIQNIKNGENLESYQCYGSPDSINQHDDAIGTLYVGEKFILSGSDDKLIKVWNKENGKLEYSLKYHSGSVQTLMLYGEKYIISGGNDNLIFIADLEREKVYKLKGHKASVLSLTVKDNTIYSASSDGEILIWDFHSRKLIKRIQAHGSTIYAITACNGYLLTASKDRTIAVWEIKTFEQRKRLSDHNKPVKALCSYDNNIFLSSGQDKNIMIWDAHSGNRIDHLKIDFRVGMNEFFIHNNLLFVGSGQSERIYMFELNTDCTFASKEPSKIFTGDNDHESIFVKGNCLYAGTIDGTIEVWHIDAEADKPTGTIKGGDLSKELCECQ